MYNLHMYAYVHIYIHTHIMHLIFVRHTDIRVYGYANLHENTHKHIGNKDVY
jgi:hypothetical protein